MLKILQGKEFENGIKKLKFIETTKELVNYDETYFNKFEDEKTNQNFRTIVGTATYYMSCCMIGSNVARNKAKSYENMNYYSILMDDLVNTQYTDQYLQSLRYCQDYVLQRRKDIGVLLESCVTIAILNQLVKRREFIEEIRFWFADNQFMLIQQYTMKYADIFQSTMIHSGKIPGDSEVVYLPYFGYWGDVCENVKAAFYINGMLYIVRDDSRNIDDSLGVGYDEARELYGYVLLNKLAKKIVDGELIDKTIRGLAVYNLCTGSLKCAFLSDEQLDEAYVLSQLLEDKLRQKAKDEKVELKNYDISDLQERLIKRDDRQSPSDMKEGEDARLANEIEEAKLDMLKQKQKMMLRDAKKSNAKRRFKNIVLHILEALLYVFIIMCIYFVVRVWLPQYDLVEWAIHYLGLE